MALKKCSECQKEISTSADTCPNCGTKKPFKGIKLTRDETKAISFKERESFEKAGGKVTKGLLENIKNGIIFIIIAIIVISIITPKPEKDIKKEIEQIEKSINSIPFDNIEDNLKGYKKLSEYYPDNKKYKAKYDFYESRSSLMGECQYLSKLNNKASLNNKSTYDESWDNMSMNWIGTEQYEFTSSFSGKNSFGVEQKFISKYRCNYNNGKTLIKRIYIKKY